MHKPVVFNRLLNEKWSTKNNEIMVKKLNNVKPKINIQCPESFFFYKKIFNRTAERNTKMQQYEIKKNNAALFHKLIQAARKCHSKDIIKKPPQYRFNKNVITGTKKFEIIRIAQENQHLYKRLTERGAFYRVDQWERDFQKNQYYKSNHCIYPVINFCQTDSNYPTRYMSNTARYANKFNKTSYSHFPNTTTSNERKRANNDNTQNDYDQDNDNDNRDEGEKPKILFCKTDYILHLELCYVEFSVCTQSFLIKIETKNGKGIGYSILFDSVQSVEKIQNKYKKYDEMINDLYYDTNEDLVKIHNIEKENLICKYAKYQLQKYKEEEGQEQEQEQGQGKDDEDNVNTKEKDKEEEDKRQREAEEVALKKRQLEKEEEERKKKEQMEKERKLKEEQKEEERKRQYEKEQKERERRIEEEDKDRQRLANERKKTEPKVEESEQIERKESKLNTKSEEDQQLQQQEEEPIKEDEENKEVKEEDEQDNANDKDKDNNGKNNAYYFELNQKIKSNPNNTDPKKEEEEARNIDNNQQMIEEENVNDIQPQQQQEDNNHNSLNNKSNKQSKANSQKQNISDNIQEDFNNY